MKREVDKRKTQKALRKLRRAAEAATAEEGPGLTTWEKDFVEGVTTRLETYGSAFRDPSKGRLEDALSSRQTHIVRVIDKKSRASSKKAAGDKSDNKPPDARKHGATLSRGKPKWTPRVRDINEDVPAQPAGPETPERRRIHLKVVPGGKSTGRGR